VSTTLRNSIFLAALVLYSVQRGVLADPPPGHQWKPIPELSDEFNGDHLDSSKWDDHDPKWQGRPPALFLPSNVEVKDGMLNIAARAEEPPAAVNPNPKMWHTFTTGFVKSKTLAKYGYFEVRAKLPPANVDAAFWFYKVDPDWHTEIDVYEIFGGNPKQDTADRMTVHIFTTPDYHDKTKEFFKSGLIYHAPFKFADDFHVFGLLWDADELKWFIDGKVCREIKNTYNHQAIHMCFDVETCPTWMGLPTVASLPAIYQVDYVRSWQRLDAPPTTAPSAAAAAQ